MVEQTIDELSICIWKQLSKDENSTTFQHVKDESNPLYKCYDCLGYTNVCGGYKPIKDLKYVNGDYR